MKLHKSSSVAALILAVTVALSGCGVMEPTATVTPALTETATETPIDPTVLIGEVIDPVETVWAGRDSGGDRTVFTLHEDGTAAVQYNANAYDDPNDTWSVNDGVLHLVVHLDAANGAAEYTGTWNAETSSIDAVMTTTVTKRTLTVTLVQQ